MIHKTSFVYMRNEVPPWEPPMFHEVVPINDGLSHAVRHIQIKNYELQTRRETVVHALKLWASFPLSLDNAPQYFSSGRAIFVSGRKMDCVYV